MFNQQLLVERMRALRAARGMTLEQVSDAVGVERSTVGYWFKGETMPPADAIAEMAALFGVTSDYLLGMTPYESGLPPDAWLFDRVLYNKAMAARSLADLQRLREAHDVQTIVPGGPPLLWAVKVPRFARLLEHAEYERLRSDLVRVVSPLVQGGTSDDRGHAGGRR